SSYSLAFHACSFHFSFPFFLFLVFLTPSTTLSFLLSLHDALPIWIQYCIVVESSPPMQTQPRILRNSHGMLSRRHDRHHRDDDRSEEHTSELQSRFDLVCRLLLEKKNTLSHIITVPVRMTSKSVTQ